MTGPAVPAIGRADTDELPILPGLGGDEGGLDELIAPDGPIAPDEPTGSDDLTGPDEAHRARRSPGGRRRRGPARPRARPDPPDQPARRGGRRRRPGLLVRRQLAAGGDRGRGGPGPARSCPGSWAPASRAASGRSCSAPAPPPEPTSSSPTRTTNSAPSSASWACAVVGLFAHQLLRGRRRANVVESLSGIALLLVAVVALAAPLELRHQVDGPALTTAVLLCATAALVAGHLVDWVWSPLRFDPAVRRGLPAVVASVLAGAAVGVARLHHSVEFTGQRAALLGASLALVTALFAVGAAFVAHRPAGRAAAVSAGAPARSRCRGTAVRVRVDVAAGLPALSGPARVTRRRGHRLADRARCPCWSSWSSPTG